MLFNQMVNQLMNELNFDFNNPSYKKLDQDLSEKVRKIYSFYASECHLDKNKPIYSPNGVLIAFWDKKSRGTKHMIDLAKKYGLHIRIVYY